MMDDMGDLDFLLVFTVIQNFILIYIAYCINNINK